MSNRISIWLPESLDVGLRRERFLKCLECLYEDDLTEEIACLYKSDFSNACKPDRFETTNAELFRTASRLFQESDKDNFKLEAYFRWKYFYPDYISRKIAGVSQNLRHVELTYYGAEAAFPAGDKDKKCSPKELYGDLEFCIEELMSFVTEQDLEVLTGSPRKEFEWYGFMCLAAEENERKFKSFINRIIEAIQPDCVTMASDEYLGKESCFASLIYHHTIREFAYDGLRNALLFWGQNLLPLEFPYSSVQLKREMNRNGIETLRPIMTQIQSMLMSGAEVSGSIGWNYSGTIIDQLRVIMLNWEKSWQILIELEDAEFISIMKSDKQLTVNNIGSGYYVACSRSKEPPLHTPVMSYVTSKLQEN